MLTHLNLYLSDITNTSPSEVRYHFEIIYLQILWTDVILLILARCSPYHILAARLILFGLKSFNLIAT